MSRDYVLQSFRPGVELHIDYAAELNPQQCAAVTAPPGPALVIAGAGSGKTRTLTYRVAFLLEQGVPPDRILLLTFTNKAAREMMRRVTELLGRDVPELWGGTFHSIGARILRREAQTLGYRPDFTILDREDAEALIKACIGGAGVDTPAARFPKPEVVADLISTSVNKRTPLTDLVAGQYSGFEPILAGLAKVAGLYVERKRAANVMDFDDLLALWLQLMESDETARASWQRRFHYILVDEYQDTNRIQGDLIDLLAARHGNVMAVGDDSQSIYSWRGADFRNILNFPQRHPGAKVFKIEVNYRSTPEILEVANAVITANTQQFAKRLEAARPSGERPANVACGDTHQQAAFVAQRMLELREEGTPMREMAVLYRSHFHALELQLELTRRNIPFSITSGIRFFEQAHIKDVSAHLRLVHNPTDEVSFRRVMLMLPGVGPKAAEKLWVGYYRAQNRLPADCTTPLATSLAGCAEAIPRKSAVAWAQLLATLAQLEARPLRDQPAVMIRHLLEAGYADYLEKNYENARNRLDDLEQMSGFAQQFENTTEFLTQLSLLSSLETEAMAGQNGRTTRTDDEERVRLSTIHQAKGLEFDVVFIVMLSEGMFPSARSIDSPDALEEERRLFYVAVTRARRELHLCHAQFRHNPGKGGDQFLVPSRFLEEIPEERLELWNLREDGPRTEWI